MTFTDDLVYGVLTETAGGRPYLAYATDGRHRAVFRTHKEALAYAGTMQGPSTIVKVKAEYTIL